MREKKLSVIVPIYKAEKFISTNLEIIKKSISQHFPNYEIIAVIDGAKDNSLKQARKVKQRKGSVRFTHSSWRQKNGCMQTTYC